MPSEGNPTSNNLTSNRYRYNHRMSKKKKSKMHQKVQSQKISHRLGRCPINSQNTHKSGENLLKNTPIYFKMKRK